MSEAIARRWFLGGAAALALAAATSSAAPAAAQDDDAEWNVFERATQFFLALLNAADLIADHVTIQRFVRFLYQVQVPLSDLLDEKQAVLDTIEAIECTSNAAPLVGLARARAQRIKPLLDLLEANVRTLASAIKPSGARQQADALADTLRTLRGRKLWVDRIDQVCPGTTDRTRLIADIQRSIAVVRDARGQLNQLIDKLTQ